MENNMKNNEGDGINFYDVIYLDFLKRNREKDISTDSFIEYLKDIYPFGIRLPIKLNDGK